MEVQMRIVGMKGCRRVEGRKGWEKDLGGSSLKRSMLEIAFIRLVSLFTN